MKRNINLRILLRKWLFRAQLTPDIGVVILIALAIFTLLIFGTRHFFTDRGNYQSEQKSNLTVSSNQSSINGRARVIDGDTLEIATIKVRLFGIDAPENGQTCFDSSNTEYDCGKQSSNELSRLVDGQMVVCIPRTKDRYGRSVAVCWAGDIDIGKAIVASGWAVAFDKYSRDYVEIEGLAKEQRLGLWKGNFKRPSEYRLEKQATK